MKLKNVEATKLVFKETAPTVTIKYYYLCFCHRALSQMNIWFEEILKKNINLVKQVSLLIQTAQVELQFNYILRCQIFKSIHVQVLLVRGLFTTMRLMLA